MKVIVFLSITVAVKVTAMIEATLFVGALALLALLALLGFVSGERPPRSPRIVDPPVRVQPSPPPALPAARHLAALSHPVPRWRTES